jgi:hypothetical protein
MIQHVMGYCSGLPCRHDQLRRAHGGPFLPGMHRGECLQRFQSDYFAVVSDV